MKTEKELGAILIRLLSDDVTMQEVRLVLTQLQDRPQLRERASSIGMLADEPAEVRAKHCVNMLEILVHQVLPKTITKEGERLPYPASAKELFCGLDSLIYKILRPLPSYSPWFSHVYREKYAIARFGRNVTSGLNNTEGRSFCVISEELWCVVSALEDLWGMQGDYVYRGSTEEIYLPRTEFMQKKELKQRGAKGVL